MSGSEPRPGAKPTDDMTQASPVPPRLVFTPDARQSVRVARIRTYTLLATFVLLLVGLVLILTYRPPPIPQANPVASTPALPPAESVVAAVPSAISQPVPVPRDLGAAEAASSAAAAVDTLIAAAGEKWLRATELSPQGVVAGDNAADAAAKLRKAVTIADSARRDVALARLQADVVLRASREAGSRTAFRLSVLYAALSRYLESVGADAEDRYFYHAKSEAAVEALLRLDGAEFEIQQNVANGYLRSSEERQAGIRLLARQVREALGNLDNVGR